MSRQKHIGIQFNQDYWLHGWLAHCSLPIPIISISSKCLIQQSSRLWLKCVQIVGCFILACYSQS